MTAASFRLLARTNFALARIREETRLLTITGRNKETNKENRRNPNEKEAGYETEVGGFHDRKRLLGERITDSPYKPHSCQASSWVS